ncbi:O-antigen ligase family protein [Vibrio brasiliensis]|uniref:O-antigen ligase family protein n=1 Tax=Vibrio brasiliensis TaxID=170652 RepID=UPI001EFDA5D5|nr:O-antigen ligase family protein [Vibrio brasiliensis]MCG9723793.1 O-antigen ligase family protein [Vibrio brasiliensis]
MKLIDTFAAKEFWFVLLLLSGFFKQYFNILSLDGVDFTLVVSCFLLFMLIKDFITYPNVKFVNKISLVGVCSIIFFVFFAILSLSYTPSEQYASNKILSFLICIYVYLLPQFYIKYNADVFFKFFVNVSLLLSIVFVIIVYFFPSDPLFGPLRDNYLVVGYLCGLNVLLLFALEKKFNLSMLLFLIILLLTGARGPLIFTVLVGSLIWVNMFGLIKLLSPKVILYVVSLIAVIVGLANMSDFVHDMLFSSFNRLILLFGEDKGASANVRIHHIIESWQHIQAKPWLGYGFGSYGVVTKGLDIRSYPHNIFLEIWFEVGILGLITFILFCIYHLAFTYFKLGFPVVCILLYIILNSLKSSSYAEVKFLFSFMSVFILMGVNKNSIRLK